MNVITKGVYIMESAVFYKNTILIVFLLTFIVLTTIMQLCSTGVY
jgi:hypothetical protein